MMEPPGKPVLSLHGSCDDLRGLTQATSSHNQLGTRSMPIVPSGFDQHAPDVFVSRFGNRPFSLSVSRRSFLGDETKVSHQRARGPETMDVVDLGNNAHGGQGSDAS
jgi:hypothetical protein